MKNLREKLHQQIDTLEPHHLETLYRIVQELPAMPTEPKPAKAGILGALKGGLIYMAPDFNEPLDDFEDYMPDKS